MLLCVFGLLAAVLGLCAAAAPVPPQPVPVPIHGGGGHGGVELNDDTETFSYSKSAFTMAKTMHTVFTTAPNRSGVMTYFWMTGGWDHYNMTRVKITIDNEYSLDLEEFYNAYGIAFGAQELFGTANTGKGSVLGSVYSTFQIPFKTQLSIAVAASPNCTKDRYDGAAYLVMRGTYGIDRVDLGRVTLPKPALLKLYRRRQYIDRLAFAEIFNTSKHGALLFFSYQASSGTANFLEGCMRGQSPPSQAMNESMLLSSGTEDYFQSGWYFSGGRFQFPGAGLTYQNGGPPVRIGAYKYHGGVDLLTWGKKGYRMTWRNGDTNDGHGKCTNLDAPPVGNPVRTHILFYAWVYEWE